MLKAPCCDSGGCREPNRLGPAIEKASCCLSSPSRGTESLTARPSDSGPHHPLESTRLFHKPCLLGSRGCLSTTSLGLRIREGLRPCE